MGSINMGNKRQIMINNENGNQLTAKIFIPWYKIIWKSQTFFNRPLKKKEKAKDCKH